MLVLSNYSSEKFPEYGVWNAVCANVGKINSELDTIEVTLMPPIERSEFPFITDSVPLNEWSKTGVCGKCGTLASVYGFCPICDSSRIRTFFIEGQESAILSSFPHASNPRDSVEVAAMSGAVSLSNYWGYLVRSNLNPYGFLPDLTETISLLKEWLDKMRAFPTSTVISEDWLSRVDHISNILSVSEKVAKERLRENFFNCHSLYYMDIELMADPFRSSHYAAVIVADTILNHMDTNKFDYLLNQDLLADIESAIQLLDTWRQRLYHTFGMFDEENTYDY
jgi:hypothetical protein